MALHASMRFLAQKEPSDYLAIGQKAAHFLNTINGKQLDLLPVLDVEWDMDNSRGIDRWTRLPDLPIGVHGLKGSAVIGGRIFLPGGGITLGGNSGTNAMQVYRPTMRCE